MLKKFSAVLVFLASLAPASAWADYVCGTVYFPGSIARTRVTLSSSPNCGGTITTYWICESTNTSSSCATVSYTPQEQLPVYQSLVSAADTQQAVSIGITSCRGTGALSCLYYVSFAQ